MTIALDSSNIPTLSIINKYLDSAENLKLIIATYDSDMRLLDTKIKDWDMLFGAYGEVQKYKGSAVEGTTVKAFLIRDFEMIQPLSNSVSESISVIETE